MARKSKSQQAWLRWLSLHQSHHCRENAPARNPLELWFMATRLHRGLPMADCQTGAVWWFSYGPNGGRVPRRMTKWMTDFCVLYDAAGGDGEVTWETCLEIARGTLTYDAARGKRTPQQLMLWLTSKQPRRTTVIPGRSPTLWSMRRSASEGWSL